MFKTYHANLVVSQRAGIMETKPLNLDQYDLDKAEDVAHLLIWLKKMAEELRIGNTRRLESKS